MMKTYDVLVLGSGLGGSITATLLAKLGWRVLVIDSSSHPRFAIGEATTPDISFLLKIVARKYDVPELLHLTTFHQLRDHVSSACGIKKAFSFLYHRDGEVQNPKESHQFPTLAPPLGPDCHFFRQDTDAYMADVALKYGVEIRQQTRVEEIDFQQAGVVLTSDKGEEFRGRYLIDAGGMRSPVGKKLELRDDPCRLKTKSRAMFTHMIDVKLYDEIGDGRDAYELPYLHGEGTLHHIFDGGWMWVIPFDNHPEHTNPRCSVGVLLDTDKFPERGDDPAAEFASLIERFPKVAEQFANAKPVRDWISTNRIQYSTSNIVGDRYCLLAHAGSFVDPLFSTGLNLTMTVIDDLVPILNQALTDNRFEASSFKAVNQDFQANVDFSDRVVSNAFRSFGSYDLWDAWFRVWVACNFTGTALRASLYLNYDETGDKTWLAKNDEAPYDGVLGRRFTPNRELFDKADQMMESYAAGNTSDTEAADGIRALFKEAKYLPSYFKWHDKSVRTTSTYTIPSLGRMLWWYKFHAQKQIRDEMMCMSFFGIIKYTFKSLRGHRSRVNSRKKFLKDTFYAKS